MTTWSNRTPPTTSYANRTIPTTTYTQRTDVNFLLKEDAFYLLLETGDKILLENSYSLPITWTGRTIPA